MESLRIWMTKYGCPLAAMGIYIDGLQYLCSMPIIHLLVNPQVDVGYGLIVTTKRMRYERA